MQAALSVARRVAEEMDTDVGAEVGYSVRFDERTSARTRIVYLTGKLTISCQSCFALFFGQSFPDIEGGRHFDHTRTPESTAGHAIPVLLSGVVQTQTAPF